MDLIDMFCSIRLFLISSSSFEFETTYSTSNLCWFRDRRWWSDWSIDKRKSRRSIRRYHSFNANNPREFNNVYVIQEEYNFFSSQCIILDLYIWFFNKRKENYNGGAQQNLRERYNQFGSSSFSVRSKNWILYNDQRNKWVSYHCQYHPRKFRTQHEVVEVHGFVTKYYRWKWKKKQEKKNQSKLPIYVCPLMMDKHEQWPNNWR